MIKWKFESDVVIDVDIECDQRFISIPDGPQNGTFHAPNLVNPDGESQQCIFWFIAAPQQRVELVFTEFGLRGSPPE